MIRDRRASEIAKLDAVAQERARLLELTNEALRKLAFEADRRKELIDQLTDEIEILRRAAEERLESIQRLDEALTQTRLEAEKRAALLAEMSEVLERQDREIARLRAGKT
jgi:methyl-accepting chemotaxis protein